MKRWTKSIAAFSLVLAALFVGMVLKGCGNQDIAPYGSTIEINPTEVEYVSTSGNVIQTFTVTVLDSKGKPMDGIVVTIDGGFAYDFEPNLYLLCRGPAGVDPTAVPFTGTTDKNGIYKFSMVIPSNTVWKVADPVIASLTAAPSAGILPAGTYSYRVSAIDAVGETIASQPGTISVAANDGVNVNWLAVLNATGYNIYGRTAGSEGLIGSVASGTITTFLDDGTAPPAGPPPTANTTNGVLLSPNSFTDNISVSSGTVFNQVEVKFNAT